MRQFFIIFLPFLWLPLPGQSEVVEDLYQARVPVKDHSAGQLAAATRAGLAQVFVKVSGGRAVLEDPQVGEALEQARTFMQQYQYLRVGRDGLELEIQFDQESVADILTGALLPLWTANRPPVLVWLAVDDASGRSIASRDTYPELIETVTAEFQRRGVPVEFPLYDLQDTLAVDVHDIWRLDSLTIYRASQRYGRDNVLVGRLRVDSSQRWMGDWFYLWRDETWSATGFGAALDRFVATGVQVAADAMAARYAVAATANAGDGVLVRIDGLQRYADYRASLEYLEAVELVETAVVEYAGSGTVVFRVRAPLEPAQLQRVILGKKLQPLANFQPLDPALPQAELVYQWTR